MNYEEDLRALDRIWPIGKMRIVPLGGTVLVAGAYEGRYMDYVATRFKPSRVIGYEPQWSSILTATRRLERHGKLTVLHHYGIGVHDCAVSMEKTGTDGCKVSNNAGLPHVRLKGIDGILDELGSIDLFICNMEGYETPLLAYLCATGRISAIKSLAVQFHSEHQNVFDMLTQHYGEPIYDDFPTWMLWKYSQKASNHQWLTKIMFPFNTTPLLKWILSINPMRRRKLAVLLLMILVTTKESWILNVFVVRNLL